MRSKYKVIIITIVAILFSIMVLLGGYFLYNKYIHNDIIGEVKINVNETKDGKIATERLWEFEPILGEDVIVGDATPNINVHNVPMHIADGMYFTVKFPSTKEYEWDYGKTVYATDGSFRIKVIDVLDINDLLAKAGLDDYQKYKDSDLIYTSKLDSKGSKTVCAIIRNTGYGVIADVYNNTDSLFETIADGIYNEVKGKLKFKVSAFSVYGDKLSMSRIPAITEEEDKFAPSMVMEDLYMQLKKKYFRDGNIYSTTLTKRFSEVVSEYAGMFEIMSGRTITAFHMTNKIFYVEEGDYTLGIVKINSNTSQVIMGKGIECRLNIKTLLSE